MTWRIIILLFIKINFITVVPYSLKLYEIPYLENWDFTTYEKYSFDWQRVNIFIHDIFFFCLFLNASILQHKKKAHLKSDGKIYLINNEKLPNDVDNKILYWHILNFTVNYQEFLDQLLNLYGIVIISSNIGNILNVFFIL